MTIPPDEEIKVRPSDVAIVGMACRFPGASSYTEFWNNLRAGIESVVVDPPMARDEPGTIRARSHLSGIDRFDANFFGFTRREAELLDPQHRLFLECSWEALEDAGLAGPFDVPVGVFGGMAMSTYLLNNITAGQNARPGRTFLESMDELQMAVASDRDYLTSRVSYKLDLHGPSLNVQAACATSLFAVHLACQSILNGECDVALAGAVNIPVPQASAYLYEAGLVFSDDGHCRPFDARATGTIFGTGVGVVALKLASHAVRDGDEIHAIIRGSALNNDGSSKAGFLAPNPTAQAAVIREALAVADVEARTVSYVEAHGTGTIVGDAIEVAALSECFSGAAAGSCGIGSVKSNLGHLTWAAGMAGLIKVVLALKHHEIPATLNFAEPNPALHLDQSPFFVVSRNHPWPAGDDPRRAGVSAFGLGGANAHIVLQEAPVGAVRSDLPSLPPVVLGVSARSPIALAQLAKQTADALATVDAPLRDIAWTLGSGRVHHAHRLAVAANNRSDARSALLAASRDLSEYADGDSMGIISGNALERPVVAALFTGQGAEYLGMGRDLYQREPIFATTIDDSDDILAPYLGMRASVALYGDPDRRGEPIRQIAHAQPLVFIVQMALLRLYESWGLAPSLVMGHSLGEYAAACAAGVFDLRTGLRLVAERGRLLQTLPESGAMAVLFHPQETLQAMLEEIDGVSVAAINGTHNIVISGDRQRISAACSRLEGRGVKTRLLAIPRAGHSALMDPILDELENIVSGVTLNVPSTPLVSNVSGRLADREFTDPHYWRRQLREPVQFLAGLKSLEAAGANVLVEIGAGPVLTAMARETLAGPGCRWLPTLQRDRDDCMSTRMVAGAAYAAGADLRWPELVGKGARKTHLPTYPFQRESYWVGPALDSQVPARRAGTSGILVVEWQALPAPTATPTAPMLEPGRWLLLGPDTDERAALAGELQARGATVDFAVRDDAIDGAAYDGVLDLRALSIPAKSFTDAAFGTVLQGVLEPFLGSARRLVTTSNNVKWVLFSRGGENTTPDGVANVAHAALRAAARVVSLENPALDLVRVDLPTNETIDPRVVLGYVLATAPAGDAEVAVRNNQLLVRRLTERESRVAVKLDGDATHVVIGGLRGLGLRAAATLWRNGARHIALVGRTPSAGEAQATIDKLRSAGARITEHLVDIRNEHEVEELFDKILLPGRRLGTLIHCAGQLDDAPVEAMTWSRVAAVLAPKAVGLAHVLRAGQRHGAVPTSVVLYSSTTALFGNPGQFNHAAANACLDAAATELRAEGIPSVSIAWGPWRDAGHLSDDQSLLKLLESQGERAIDARTGDAALAALLSAPVAHAAVAAYDWATFAARRPRRETGLLDSLTGGGEAQQNRTMADDSFPLPELLHTQDPAERRRLVTSHARMGVTRIVGTGAGDTGDVDRLHLFEEVGLDSLSATQLRNWIQRTLRCQLPARVVYEHPTLNELAEFIAVTVLDEMWLASVLKHAQIPTSNPQASTPATTAIALSRQQRRWLMLNREVGYGRRVVPIVMRRALDAEALRRALLATIDVHEVLRTRFPGGQAELLSAADAMPDDLSVLDVADVPPRERKNAISEAVEAVRQALGDPYVEPSWKMRCVVLSQSEFVLLIGLQHLEFDGSSLEIFAADLLDAYDDCSAGGVGEIRPATAYREYANEQNRKAHEIVTSEGPFFEALFAALPKATTLPGHPGFARTAMLPSRRHTPQLALTTWDALTQAANLHGCSPFSLVLGSYAQLIGRLTNAPTVAISIIRSARDDDRWARTVGPFTSPFPVPITVAGRTGPEVAQHTHRQVTAVTARTAFPVTALPELVPAFSSMPIDSYFSDVGINFINYRRHTRDDVRVVEILGPVEHPDFDPADFSELGRIPGLHLVAYVTDGFVRANYWFHESRFTMEQVAQWADEHRALLDDLLAGGTTPAINA